ncbi:MAG: tetratricopeptide repeat protein [Anaerolineales bacterium]
MKPKPWLLLLAALVIAAQACNLPQNQDPTQPSETPPSSPTALPSPTFTQAPLPTLTNAARAEAGDQAYFYGDWARALREYQRVADESHDDELRAAALLGIGRTNLKLENVIDARAVLQGLVAQYPSTQAAAGAYFTLADVYVEFNNFAAAAEAYMLYLELRPGVIDSYVNEWRGDRWLDAANYAEAMAAYQQSLEAARLGDHFGVQIKIGNTQSLNGDHTAAIATYQEIFDSTINEYLKADLDLLMGRAALALGDSQSAYAYYQHAVTNYPLAYSSYAALVELVNASVPVDEFQRGFIDYYIATLTSDRGVSQELYSAAVRAFDRYLEVNPEEHNHAAHYYRGLALRANGDYHSAISEWDHILAEHAFEEHWVDAFSEKASTQWLYLEDHVAAINTLLSFVASTPSQPASAEFLFRAGRIAERGGRLTRSIEIWTRIAEEYPSSQYAYDSMFLAGISSYRLEAYVQAQSMFLRAYQAALSLEDQAQSLFWLAKVLDIQADEDGARNAWEQAAAVDPTGYYSERSRDILAGRDTFEPPTLIDFDYDIQTDRREAEAWIRTTFSLPADTDLSDPGPLVADPRFQRGTELWSLTKYELARAEFEDLRQSMATDPANSYRLANYLIDLGLYRTGIFAAREVLSLAGMSDAATMNAPRYFNFLRFGAYYIELVLPETSSERLDPLFFYSMMRQESLFEGFVTSSAGARGLLQIIPSTGEEVATLSGWPPDFTPDDLYRPMVSIRLGADYLAIQLNAFDGDMYAALAAYNAGPGNASYWLGLSNGDPDLFLEIVSFEETRNHIRSIYELFTIYRNLYSAETE